MQQNTWKFAVPVSFPGVTDYSITYLRGDYYTYRREAEWQYEMMRNHQALLQAAEAEAAYYNWQAAMHQSEMELRDWQVELREREQANHQQITWSVWISFPI